MQGTKRSKHGRLYFRRARSSRRENWKFWNQCRKERCLEFGPSLCLPCWDSEVQQNSRSLSLLTSTKHLVFPRFRSTILYCVCRLKLSMDLVSPPWAFPVHAQHKHILDIQELPLSITSIELSFEAAPPGTGSKVDTHQYSTEALADCPSMSSDPLPIAQLYNSHRKQRCQAGRWFHQPQ